MDQRPHLSLLLVSLPREPVAAHMLVVVDLDSDHTALSTFDIVKLQHVIRDLHVWHGHMSTQTKHHLRPICNLSTE